MYILNGKISGMSKIEIEKNKKIIVISRKKNKGLALIFKYFTQNYLPTRLFRAKRTLF